MASLYHVASAVGKSPGIDFDRITLSFQRSQCKAVTRVDELPTFKLDPVSDAPDYSFLAREPEHQLSHWILIALFHTSGTSAALTEDILLLVFFSALYVWQAGSDIRVLESNGRIFGFKARIAIWLTAHHASIRIHTLLQKLSDAG